MKYTFMASIYLLTAALLGACQQGGLPVDIGAIGSLRVSDEEKIILILEDVERGMERRRLYQVLAHVSRNYRDRQGRDYAALSQDLNTLLRNYRDIRITRTRPRIEVQGDRARVVDSFGASAEAADPQEYPSLNLQGQVAILMERFNNTWQIIEWGPIH